MSMGTQEGYIIVTGGHMSRCRACGARTTLTKEIFSRNGKHETLSMCYDCQKNNDPTTRLPQDMRIISSKCAAGQKPLEKWIIMH